MENNNYVSTSDNVIEIFKFSMSILLALSTMFFVICFGAVLFFAIYKLKSYMGIDIFPQHHLSDFIEIVKP